MLPNDFEEVISNKEFSRSMQGYNPKQVDRYLKKMISYYWNIYQEKQKLENKISQYEKQDKHLRQALIRVEEASEEIKDKALNEAKKIKQHASLEAEKIRQEAIKDAQQIKKQTIDEGKKFIQNLIQNRKLYEEQTKELIGVLYYTVRSKINSLQEELFKELEDYTMNLESTIKNTDPMNKLNKNKKLETADNWRLKEEELLVGYVLNDDIKDNKGNIVVSKSTVVTPELIDMLIKEELYGELFTVIGDEVNEYCK